jgi:hypothetical protein
LKKGKNNMTIHRNQPTKYFLIMSMVALVTFACNFLTSKSPTSLPTETVSAAEIPTPTQALLSPNSVPLPNGLTLKSATDTERDLSSYQISYLEDAADGFLPENQSEIDMYFGESRSFTIRVNSSEGGGLVWATGWCAQGQKTLNQNLKKIQFEMAVNGQPVDLNQVYKVDDFRSWHTSGNICLLYRIIVNGWASGTTTLTSKTIITEPINDGIKDYPAGELIRTYEIINSTESTNSLFQDNFVNSCVGWEIPDVENTNPTGKPPTLSCGKGLFLRQPDPHKVDWVVPHKNWENVVIEVDATIVSGVAESDHGVLCRLNDKGQFYMFTISGDGQYAVWRRNGINDFTKMTENTYSNSIHPQGQTNHIKAVCNDVTLAFYVNGVKLIQINTGKDILSGDVGLIVGTRSSGDLVVRYDNFKVTSP